MDSSVVSFLDSSWRALQHIPFGLIKHQISMKPYAGYPSNSNLQCLNDISKIKTIAGKNIVLVPEERSAILMVHNFTHLSYQVCFSDEQKALLNKFREQCPIPTMNALRIIRSRIFSLLKYINKNDLCAGAEKHDN